MSCLYILEINPLLVASFASIFSHSESCLFILFMVPFAVQKLLSLIRSHLFIFVFIHQPYSARSFPTAISPSAPVAWGASDRSLSFLIPNREQGTGPSTLRAPRSQGSCTDTASNALL